MAQPLIKKDDDRDDDADYSPFMGIEKGAVLQEARVFNDPQLDPRRCSQVITKLLYLLNQGENFTKVEATEVFFSVTKLFQSKDSGLRRMVYLMIKELSPSSDEVDPSTGEAEDDGVEDEYQLEDSEVVAADYILRVGVSNFRNAWESIGTDFERVDEYGLGPRENLADAVNAVITLLGMQPCEGTEVVPNNSRSHTCLLSGVYMGSTKVLVRSQFGLDSSREVAMKLTVRSQDDVVSDTIHEIVASG